ncbi:MAG: SGNH/GDSL hydrolase family protein [Anaerolineae bacterium]
MKPSVPLSAYLLVVTFAFLIVLAVILWFPSPLIYDTTQSNALIHIEADRSWIFTLDDCVNISWTIQYAAEVYYNDRLVDPTGTDQFCNFQSYQPQIRVVLNDGGEFRHSNFIQILIERPEFWIVLALAATSFGLAIITRLSTIVLRWRKAHNLPPVTLLDKLLIGIGSAVVLIVWTFAVLEGTARLYLTLYGTEYQRVAYFYSREEINRRQMLTIPMPEIGFGLSPWAEDINHLGMRGEEVSAIKPQGVFRIIAMGDSTTYGFLEAPRNAYPVQLQRILRDDYGYTNVEVLNAGVTGYNSFHIMQNLETRYLALDPDLVIFYSNYNDVENRWQPQGCYAGDNANLGLDPTGRMATWRADQPLSPSVLYRFFTINSGLEPDPARINSLFIHGLIPCARETLPTFSQDGISNPPIYYRRNLITIAAIADYHHVHLMMATWSPRENYTDVPPRFVEYLEDNNQVMRAVAAEYHVPLLDYAPMMPQDPSLWIDHVHYNVDGMHLQAEVFAEFIDAQGWIPHPRRCPACSPTAD